MSNLNPLWKNAPLHSLTNIKISNGVFKNPQKTGTGIKLINVVDLYNDTINFDALERLDVSEEDLQKNEAIEGDLLFTRSSLKAEGIAHCNLVRKYPEQVIFECHIMRFRPNKNIINSYFLFSYCSLPFARKEFVTRSKTTTMTTIDQNGLGSVRISFPPLPEQEKIAEILGTWDTAIEKLSALIEQKKQLKKGLMQRLLTGKQRLPGFSDPWKKVKLGEILEAISKRNKDLKITRVLSVTNSRGFVLPEEQFSRTIASEDLSNYKIVKKGEFAYNPSRLNVGSIDRLDTFENGLLSPMYVVFKCKNILMSNYMRQWISTDEFNIKIKNSAQGSVRETVDFKTLSSVKTFIPLDLSEQKAIADILSKADEEITLLTRKLSALKSQKKGLMQKLLTGQIRVKAA